MYRMGRPKTLPENDLVAGGNPVFLSSRKGGRPVMPRGPPMKSSGKAGGRSVECYWGGGKGREKKETKKKLA